MKHLKDIFSGLASIFEPKTEEDLLDASANLKQLLLASQTMTSIRDMDEMLNYLLGEIRKSISAGCGVLMLDEGQHFRVRCHKGFSAELVTGLKVPLGEGAIGESFSFGQKLVLERRDFSRLRSFEPMIVNEAWKSLLLAPLSIQNRSLGVFLCGSGQDDYFDEMKSDILDPFLQILAVGIRNAQLIEGMEKFNRRLAAEISSTTQELTQTNNRLIHRVRELKALYEITLSAGQSESIEDIFAAVSEKIQNIFEVKHVAFFISAPGKEDSNHLVSLYNTFSLPRESQKHLEVATLPGAPQPGSIAKIIADVFNSGEHKIYRGGPTDIIREFALQSGLQSFSQIRIDSLVAFPLRGTQKVLGVMILANPQINSSMGSRPGPENFTDEEIRTLTIVAVRVATAIENVLLDQEIHERLSDLSALKEINDAFYSSTVMEFSLGKIIKIVLKSLKCDLCDLHLVDSDHKVRPNTILKVNPAPKDKEAKNLTTQEEHIIQKVLKDRRQELINDVQDVWEIYGSASKLGIRSLLFVPIQTDEDVIGVLRLGSREKSYFNRHHLRLAGLIADRVAVILQNVRLYEKIIHANQELERLNRVKTEFVSMVSHELRTPVTAVKGFVDIIRAEEVGPINEQQRKFLNIAHNSIDRLTVLISDLLDISRIESGQLKVEPIGVAIEKILSEAVETYRQAAEAKKVSLSIDIMKKIPQVMVDDQRIKQVIDNLISNAMKFTPPGGSIRLGADDLGDFILVSVQDNGVGIKKDDQERIFSMFYQVDSSLTRRVGGTGLGLAITKAIVELHGGRIWVESEPGKGSTFRFLIPRARLSRQDH